MDKRPLSVAISALIKNNRILLIKRTRGDYIGYLGLPGGKVENEEHVSDAATREILEESGIDSVFRSHLGIVSEHLFEDGAFKSHFLLHICELEPKTTKIMNDSEGKLEWFELESLPEIKDRIIPSDYRIIKEMVLEKKKPYFNCIMHKEGQTHKIMKFE
jgi:ADP-ribose pyrophosphatase YjhB (NUDIX family)